MKRKWLLGLGGFLGIVSSGMALHAVEDTSSIACSQRGFKYCQLPNVADNCSIGTCNSSLSSSGNCTVEAIFNSEGSSLVSCSVCSTEDIDQDACRLLGGTIKQS